MLAATRATSTKRPRSRPPANNAGGEDNITVVAFEMTDEPDERDPRRRPCRADAADAGDGHERRSPSSEPRRAPALEPLRPLLVLLLGDRRRRNRPLAPRTMSERNRELLNLFVVGALTALGFAIGVHRAPGGSLDRLALVRRVLLRPLPGRALRRAVPVPNADPYLLPMAALLTAIGVTEIYRLNPDDAFRQGLWIVIAVGVFVATLLVLRRDYRVLESYKYLFGMGALFLLVLPALPGDRHDRQRRTALGARRPVPVPARRAREARADRLPRRLPPREARGDRAGPPQGLRPAARDLGRRDARSRRDERPRQRASLLRGLPRDAVRRHRTVHLRRSQAPRCSSSDAAGVYKIFRARARPRRRLAQRLQVRARRTGYQIVQARYSIAHGGFGGTGLGNGIFTQPGSTAHAHPVPEHGLHLCGARAGARTDRRGRIVARLHALRRARLPHRAARQRRVLEAARGRSDVRFRAPVLHHRRRDRRDHSADRHHDAVRQLRRLQRGRELRLARGPDAGLQPCQHGRGEV